MSALQVTTAVQAINLGGLNEAFALQNNGPFTVYVDDNTSVNSSSHAIPPTGSLQWDAGKELFIVADPLAGKAYSTVSIIPNGNVAIYGNETDNLLDNAGTLNDGSYVNGMERGPIDCSAYQSLSLQIFIDQVYTHAQVVSLAKTWIGVFAWYDEHMNLLSTTNFMLPFPAKTVDLALGNYIFPDPLPSENSKIVVPVRGTYVKFIISASAVPTITKFSYTLTGSTRVIEPAMNMTVLDGMPHVVEGLPQSAIFSSFSRSGWTFNDLAGLGYHDIYPSNLSAKVCVTVSWAVGTSAEPGKLTACDVYDSTILYGNIVLIPIQSAPSTGRYAIETIFNVPLYQPWMLHWEILPTQPQPIPMTISLTYL